MGCSTLDLIAATDVIVTVHLSENPIESGLATWRGKRSDEEISALTPTNFWVAHATIESVITERKEGPNVELTRRLTSGDQLTVARAENDAARGFLLGAADSATMTVLASVMNSTIGQVLTVFAVLPDPKLYNVSTNEACDVIVNKSLSVLADQMGGESQEVLPQLVMNYYVDPNIASSIESAEFGPQMTTSEQLARYSKDWLATPPEARPLQLGQVPGSLIDQVKVGGIYLRILEDDPKYSELVVWSDLGVSLDIVGTAGSGPNVVVLPVGQSVRVSLRQEDGSLGDSLASLDPADVEKGVTLLLEYDPTGPSATLRVIGRDEFAELSEMTVSALDNYETQYADMIAYDPTDA